MRNPENGVYATRSIYPIYSREFAGNHPTSVMHSIMQDVALQDPYEISRRFSADLLLNENKIRCNINFNHISFLFFLHSRYV